jgi:hypothetical protein
MLPPEKMLKFRASETPFRAFWGEILQNSKDYNIIIRSYTNPHLYIHYIASQKNIRSFQGLILAIERKKSIES